ncbi:MAG: extracellular solute-binding protein [Oscillospiraceae bacterium]
MKLAKRLLAGSVALIMALGMASCDKSDNTTTGGEGFTDKQKEIVEKMKEKLPEGAADSLENKEITWLAHYDINPANGKAASPGLELFQSVYGGKINYKATTWENRYNDLATGVMSGNGPDFFPADDMDTFPRGAIKNQFDPIDDYIDYDSDLWKSSKEQADAFEFNGKHYICVIKTVPTYACIYNKTTIEDNGLEDPAELFEKGEWDWDVFEEMCKDFTNEDEDMYGLDGYWYNKAISESCGVPMITLKDGQLVENMSDPQIEKVQTRMYELQKNNVVFPRCDNDWNTRGSGANGEGLGSGLTLFIPIGLYAIEDTPEKTKNFGNIEEGEVMFVPMPKDPDSDTYYISAKVNGYNLCHNAPNPEGFAAYMTCLKVAADNGGSEIYEDQLRNDYKWTDEMIEMRKKMYEMVIENPVYDLQDGVSAELSTQMVNVSQATMITGGDAMSWTKCRSSYQKSIKWLLNDANEEIKKVNG